MANLHYKIILNNNVEYVFDKLFDKAVFEEWTKVFNPDSKMRGTLAKGEEVFFYDADENGMLALVSEYQVNKLIEFTYLADVMNGEKRKYPDNSNHERYTFTNLQDEMVMVDIDLDIPDEYKDMFEDMWTKAIVEIQNIFDNADDDI